MHNIIKGLGIQAIMGVRNKEETLVHAIDFEAGVLGEVLGIIRSARPKGRTKIELWVEYLPHFIEILKGDADLNILSRYIKMIPGYSNTGTYPHDFGNIVVDEQDVTNEAPTNSNFIHNRWDGRENERHIARHISR